MHDESPRHSISAAPLRRHLDTPRRWRMARPRPDGRGGWIWSIKGVRRLPYRLPELLEALGSEQTIFIAEGEKDVDNLRRLGAPATCNLGGVGKWHAELNQYFAGADVVIIGDRNEAGRDHVRDVAAKLKTTAARIRVIDIGHAWPACPNKGDVSDWIAAGLTIERLNEIVEQLPTWNEPDEPPPRKGLRQTSSQFVADFVPPDYLLDGVLQRRFLYSFTGRTGSGKTAVVLLLAAVVALGRKIGNLEVAPGRVFYFCGENPDDVRMRWIALAQQMDFDINTIAVDFFPGRFRISEMYQIILADAQVVGGVVLIIVDTSAAYFEGEEPNNNKQQAEHAQRLRTLADLPGGPCVLVNCHPVKNAAPDNLIPYGGGAFVNEVDGNLTCAIGNTAIEVSWQGKFRGPDFAPLTFKVRSVTHERLKDSRGRLIPTVIAEYLSEAGQQEIERAARSHEDQLLAVLAEPGNGKASHAELAKLLGWFMRDGSPYRKRVSRTLEELKKAKLITITRDGIELTAAGRKSVGGTKPAKPAVKVHIIGDAPADAVCMHCHQAGGVKRITNASAPGSKSETLHEGCAAEWFAKLSF
jgi:AAA domain